MRIRNSNNNGFVLSGVPNARTLQKVQFYETITELIFVALDLFVYTPDGSIVNSGSESSDPPAASVSSSSLVERLCHVVNPLHNNHRMWNGIAITSCIGPVERIVYAVSGNVKELKLVDFDDITDALATSIGSVIKIKSSTGCSTAAATATATATSTDIPAASTTITAAATTEAETVAEHETAPQRTKISRTNAPPTTTTTTTATATTKDDEQESEEKDEGSSNSEDDDDIDDDSAVHPLVALEALRLQEGNIPSKRCMELLVGVVPASTAATSSGLSTSTSLHTLELNQIEFHPQALKCLGTALQHNKSINTLKLFGCNLSDTALERLIPQLPNTIDDLDLGRNKCRSKSITALSNWLRKPSCRLAILSLYQQQQQQQSSTLTSQVDTATLNNHHTNDDHTNDHDDTLDLSSMANALEHNRSLHTLLLSYNPLSDSCINQLGQALTKNTTLKQLDLQSCHLSYNAIQAFSKNFQQFHGLFELNLSGCQDFLQAPLSSSSASSSSSQPMIGVPNEKGYLALLLQGLMTNVSLERLLLPEEEDEEEHDVGQPHHHHQQQEQSSTRDGTNQAESSSSSSSSTFLTSTKAYRQQIDHWLDLNRGGRRILQLEHVPLGLWPLVLERTYSIMHYDIDGPQRSASIVYHLLRGPVLLQRY